MKDHIIEVTQNDITNGERAQCKSCPVALALKRKLHRVVSVSREYVTIFYPDVTEKTVNTPIEVSEFIRLFDAGCELLPFKFTLKDEFSDAGVY